MTLQACRHGIRTLNEAAKTRRKLLEMASASLVACRRCRSASRGETTSQRHQTAARPTIRTSSTQSLPRPRCTSRGSRIVNDTARESRLVERDGCFYSTDRPSRSNSQGLDSSRVSSCPITPQRRVFVTEDGLLLETIDVQGSFFSYVLTSDSRSVRSRGGRQDAPTVPPI